MSSKWSKERLSYVQEKAVIKYMLTRSQTGLSFKTVCDQRMDIFGTPGSSIHERCQNQKDYLKDPRQLQKACNELNQRSEALTSPPIVVSSFDSSCLQKLNQSETQHQLACLSEIPR
jgi:hypothetical protein